MLFSVVQTFNKYDTITKSVSSGNSTGNHLHICVIVHGQYQFIHWIPAKGKGIHVCHYINGLKYTLLEIVTKIFELIFLQVLILWWQAYNSQCIELFHRKGFWMTINLKLYHSSKDSYAFPLFEVPILLIFRLRHKYVLPASFPVNSYSPLLFFH